mgnify:CR=1 FL=1
MIDAPSASSISFATGATVFLPFFDFQTAIKFPCLVSIKIFLDAKTTPMATCTNVGTCSTSYAIGKLTTGTHTITATATDTLNNVATTSVTVTK